MKKVRNVPKYENLGFEEPTLESSILSNILIL